MLVVFVWWYCSAVACAFVKVECFLSITSSSPDYDAPSSLDLVLPFCSLFVDGCVFVSSVYFFNYLFVLIFVLFDLRSFYTFIVLVFVFCLLVVVALYLLFTNILW